MKTRMLSLLTAAALFSGVAAANAAEPVTLSDAQMDSVAAGLLNVNVGTGAGQIGLANVAAVPIGVGVISLL